MSDHLFGPCLFSQAFITDSMIICVFEFSGISTEVIQDKHGVILGYPLSIHIFSFRESVFCLN